MNKLFNCHGTFFARSTLIFGLFQISAIPYYVPQDSKSLVFLRDDLFGQALTFFFFSCVLVRAFLVLIMEMYIMPFSLSRT